MQTAYRDRQVPTSVFWECRHSQHEEKVCRQSCEKVSSVWHPQQVSRAILIRDTATRTSSISCWIETSTCWRTFRERNITRKESVEWCSPVSLEQSISVSRTERTNKHTQNWSALSSSFFPYSPIHLTRKISIRSEWYYKIRGYICI